VKRIPLWILLLTSVGACTSRAPVNRSQFQVAPALTVERFLQAANTRDLETMSERSVPGAEAPSNRIGVDLSLPGGLRVGDVGFTVVLESSNRWLISVIELTKITEAG
jgi:hypothetical protein